MTVNVRVSVSTLTQVSGLDGLPAVGTSDDEKEDGDESYSHLVDSRLDNLFERPVFVLYTAETNMLLMYL